MNESSGGKLSSEQEDEWLQKAVEQLKNGMNITVEYLGKMELQMSISKEPDPEKRIDIIVGCLREISRKSGILENPEIPEVAGAFLEGAKVRAKEPRLAALNISARGFGLALVDYSIPNPILSWHPVGEVAFAHVDPEHEDIVGYYATKRSTNQRFCYAVRSECGAHILACMKLAFTVFEQQNSEGDIDIRTVAEAMTPSPTTPSKGGAYSLLRISSPNEDLKELVHREVPIPVEAIQKQVLQVPKAINKKESSSTVTNVYLNVMMPPANPHNPYHVQHIYRGLGNFFGFNEYSNQKSTILEKIIEQNSADSGNEEEVKHVPPLMTKPEKFKIRSRDKLNLLGLNDRIHPGHEDLLYPEIRFEKSKNFENFQERIKKEKKLMKERLKIKNFRIEESPEVQKPKKKVFFRTVRNSLKKHSGRITVPLKKKLGTLRIQEENSESTSLKSEYSSVNSKSFNGSVSSHGSSSPSSTDSGVIDEDDLFVFPENSADAPSWKKRIFRSQQPLQISGSRFAQISEYLDEEPWFHGTVRRDLAEARLVKDGEFLVRQSGFQPGQFILSILKRKIVHHICLVNNQGQIRSYGNEFGSIVQLIQYHFATRVPMCTKTTAVILNRPVARP